ncbi:ATP-binding protein [Luteolibacter marinus]|uniref:ATP-binding protein n=1 Tax=Luteolibacter marinus TaxID=2776705 RepID=UPI001868FD8F|nr:ATP-binding protein [Luteolibacter marinus]
MTACLAWMVGAMVAAADSKERWLGHLGEELSQGGVFSGAMSGKILDLNPAKGLIALADASGAEILRLPVDEAAWQGLEVGVWVEIEFRNSHLQRDADAIHGGALVDLDGWHALQKGQAVASLSKGMHRIRISWFNAYLPAELRVEISGPGSGSGPVPASMLWHLPAEGEAPEPGLQYEAFRIPKAAMLSDLEGVAPFESGVIHEIGLGVAGGKDNVALKLEGLLSVPEDGDYTLTLVSDDGARLEVEEDAPEIRLLPGAPVRGPLPESPARESAAWKTLSGRAVFVSREGEGMSIQLESGGKESEVRVLDAEGLDEISLQGRRLTVSGLAGEDGMRVLGASGVRSEVADPVDHQLLTKIMEVRELGVAQAASGLRVSLQGVVTMSTYRSLVIQDESGGAFVVHENLGSPRMPRPGEIWSIEGKTARGDFSPVVVAERSRFVRRGSLPPPQRPRWEQLLNGSLDAEWVEIEGVITSFGEGSVELLTREGFITIGERMFYPMVRELRDPDRKLRLTGSRVRFRGVFATSWDVGLGRLHPGLIHLGNATMAIDQAGPADPSEVPLVEIPDLWSFASKSKALDRVRLKVQLMARGSDMCVMSDGQRSLRLLTGEALDAEPGDLVEVTGFPRVGAISPYLLHPMISRSEPGAMPAAREVSGEDLLDATLDGRVVELTGTVLSDTLRKEERVLEMRSGKQRFFAVVNGAVGPDDPLRGDTTIRARGVYVAGWPDAAPGVEGPFELHLVEADAIKVLKSPPWWTTRRLVLLVTALLGGLALVLVWVMMLRRQVTQRTSMLAIGIREKEHAESERMLEEERARVARDLHDELGAGLTEIGMLGSLLKHPGIDEGTRMQHAETLGETSASLVSGLDEIVWAVNPRYDSIQDSASYLWLYASRMLKPAGIECRFEQSGEIPFRRFGSRRRHSLFLAFKEALNNVVRHSRGTAVDLSIGVENEAVVVTVADNGRGFDADAGNAVGSDGLAGMRERMRQFGGDCSIESHADRGTTVRLVLPLRDS